MAWKEKNERLLKNKRDIIKQYKDYVPVKLIARDYGVSEAYIYLKIKLWDIERSGIKYLLHKALLEGD